MSSIGNNKRASTTNNSDDDSSTPQSAGDSKKMRPLGNDDNQQHSRAYGPSMSLYVWGQVDVFPPEWTKEAKSEKNEHGRRATVSRPLLLNTDAGDVRQVAFNDDYLVDAQSGFLLKTDGTVRKYWSTNDYDSQIPLQQHIMNIDQEFKSICSGVGHCAGILQDGRLVMWGMNTNGQLEWQNDVIGEQQENDEIWESLEYKLPSILDLPNHCFKQVCCGDDSTLALTSLGVVFSWGLNKFSGHGVEDGHQLVPKKIDSFGDTRVTCISLTCHYTATVTQVGEVYHWGALPHGDVALLPTKIESLSPVEAKTVSCGDSHSAVLSHDGKAYCFGRNTHGQLGQGHKEKVQHFVLVEALQHVNLKKIICGTDVTLAITEAGEVFSWGCAEYALVGHSSLEEDVTTPTKIHPLTSMEVVDVVGFGYHLVAFTRPRTNDFVPAPVLMQKPHFNNKDAFPDVTFLVEGKELYGHRFILAQRCDLFQTMFSSGMKESLGNDEIVIHDVKHETFLKLLAYLYTDEIKLSQDNVLAIFRLADMYGLPKLCDHCCRNVEKFLSVDNVVAFLHESDAFNSVAIRSMCIDFVRFNFAAVSKKNDFGTAISHELLLEIVKGTSLW